MMAALHDLPRDRRPAKTILADILRVGELVLAAPRFNATLGSEITKLQQEVERECQRVHVDHGDARVIGDEEEIALFALAKVTSGAVHQGIIGNRWADVGRSLLELCQRKFAAVVDVEQLQGKR